MHQGSRLESPTTSSGLLLLVIILLRILLLIILVIPVLDLCCLFVLLFFVLSLARRKIKSDCENMNNENENCVQMVWELDPHQANRYTLQIKKVISVAQTVSENATNQCRNDGSDEQTAMIVSA